MGVTTTGFFCLSQLLVLSTTIRFKPTKNHQPRKNTTYKQQTRSDSQHNANTIEHYASNVY